MIKIKEIPVIYLLPSKASYYKFSLTFKIASNKIMPVNTCMTG